MSRPGPPVAPSQATEARVKPDRFIPTWTRLRVRPFPLPWVVRAGGCWVPGHGFATLKGMRWGLVAVIVVSACSSQSRSTEEQSPSRVLDPIEPKQLPAYYDPKFPDCPPRCPARVATKRQPLKPRLPQTPSRASEVRPERKAEYLRYLESFLELCEGAEIEPENCRPFTWQEWNARSHGPLDPLRGLNSL